MRLSFQEVFNPSPSQKNRKMSATDLGQTSFYPQPKYFLFFNSCLTCFWPPLLKLARQPLLVPFGKLQISITFTPNNHLLNPSVMVTVRHSVPILFLYDDPYNEICQGKGIFARELPWNCQVNPFSRFSRHTYLRLCCK